MRKSGAPSMFRQKIFASNSSVKKDVNGNVPLLRTEDSINDTSSTELTSNVPGALRSTEDILELISGIQNRSKIDLSKNDTPAVVEKRSAEHHSTNKRLHATDKSEKSVIEENNSFCATVTHGISDEELDNKDTDDDDMKKNPNVASKCSVSSQRLGTSKRLCITPETSIYKDTSENLEHSLTPDDIRGLNASGKKLQPPKNPMYFNVLWCKKSARKHKKWEGDAILIVTGCSAVLKDMEKKEMARGLGYKIKEVTGLEEGSKFFIGGKECEIQSVISEEDYISEKCFTEC